MSCGWCFADFVSVVCLVGFFKQMKILRTGIVFPLCVCVALGNLKMALLVSLEVIKKYFYFGKLRQNQFSTPPPQTSRPSVL